MDELRIWTIYRTPDHPARCVIRGFDVCPNGTVTPSEDLILLDTLQQARALMQRNGLFCLGRALEDDAGIVESWI